MHRSVILTVLLFINFALFAQNGPGGVGNYDGSSSQPENSLWLDAGNLSLSGSDPVASWPDFSGNSNNAGQTDSDLRPIYKTGQINGLPTIYFDGSNDYLLVPDADKLDITDGVTVIVVAKPDTPDNTPRGLVSKRINNGSEEAYSLFTYSDSYLYFDAGSERINGTVAATADAQIFAGNYNGSIANPRSKVYNDGAQSGSGNGPVSVGNQSSDLHIGILNHNYGSGFRGDIAEVIIYRNSLNEAQMQIVHQYLNVKYGIPIPNDLYSPNAAYVSGIAGIGKVDAANEHSLTSSAGLYLTSLSGVTNGDYVFTSHDNADNTISDFSSLNLPSGIDERYNRIWYAAKTGNPTARISFDFSEATGTEKYPANHENYVLLFRAGTSGEFSVVKNAEGIVNGDQVYFNLNETELSDGYYTLGTENSTDSPLEGVEGRTWYTLISDNWNNWEVWTLDPSGALPDNPDQLIPSGTGPNVSPTSAADKVVILNGKTVTCTEGNLQNAELTVDGRLDINTTSGHSFGLIKGSGRILMQGDNFPSGDAKHFYTYGQGAGTAVYQTNGSLTTYDLNETRDFYNVEIDLFDNSHSVVLKNNYDINNDLLVKKGIFQINDNATETGLEVTVNKNITIQENGKIHTGEADARHQLNIYGNLINDGEVKFTNRTSPAYLSQASDGIVDANFLNTSKDQTIECNNTTNFYRIETDKGNMTYTLHITATSTDNFKLYGFADEHHSNNSQLSENNNALGLITGTVRIGNNVEIPVLCRETNYNISENARLWVDGGTVKKNDGTAIVPYGEIKVTNGLLEAKTNSGITTRGTGLIRVEGGTVNVNQIRTSIYGSTHVGGYYQSGGTVNVYGVDTPTSWYVFNLTYGGNTFAMSGGTLHIHQARGKGGIFIASDEVNQNVTGGTVILEINDGNDFGITSKAPFYNLIIRNIDSGTGKHILTDATDVGGLGVDLDQQDLVVLNDLTIETGTTRSDGTNVYGSYLNLVPDDVTASDLYIGGDLIIEDSGVLDIWAWDGTDNSGSSTVTFNGSENAVLYVGDIATYTNALVEFKNPDDGPWPSGFAGADETYGVWTLPFYNLIVDKPNATLSLASKLPGKGHGSPHGDPAEYRNANGGKNISRIGGWLIRVTNKIAILNGTFSQIDSWSTVTMLEDDGVGFGDVGDPVDYSIAISNAQVINNDTLFVYEDGVTPKNGNIIFRIGGDLTLETTENAYFGNLAVNNSTTGGLSYVLSLTSDVKIGRMQFSSGILDIDKYNLKVDVFEFMPAEQTLEQSDEQAIFTTNDFIRMAGNASDGGLSIKLPRSLTLYESSTPSFPDPAYTKEINVVDRIQYYEDGQEYNTPDRLWFPIGTDAGGSDKYTPAVMYIVDDAAVTYSGDEYVTVRLVNKELQTTDLSGGDIIQYYWNVDHEGFDEGLPEVSWIFQYDDSDISGDESTYVPGKVLDGGAYTRSTDGDATGVKHSGAAGNNGDILGTNPNNIIVFNGITGANDDIDTGTGDAVFDRGIIGNNWTTAFPGTGITLENANYTAGEANRFVGAPTIYYNRRNATRNWNDNTSWYDTPTGTNNPPDYPTAGDIAVIRGNNFQDAIEVNGTQAAAEIILEREGTYADIEDIPRLFLNPTDVLNVGKITGLGELYLQQTLTNSATVNADIGEFAANNTSVVIFYMTQNGTYNVSEAELFPEFPVLRIYGQLAGYNRTASFDYDFNAKQLLVDGEANFLVGGNYTVENRTRLGYTGGGRIIFPNGTESYRLKTGNFVTGRAKNSGNNNYQLTVQTGGGNGIEHFFEVEKNIDLNFADAFDEGTCTVDLFSSSVDNNVILHLSDTGNHAFNDNYSAGNSSVELYKIEMNKGSDITSTFTFNDNFTLNAPTSVYTKTIELQNGKLILNDPNINVDLTAADDVYYIPGTAGLEVRQGQAKVNGNSGILLDGKLQISGGTVDMTGGDNYIQYSASGNAEIEISDGNLLVGSQVRRGLTSTEGILTYIQTGGNAEFGIDAAPQNSRGIFEILNTGSSFTFTGGTFSLANDYRTSPSTQSLYFSPENVSFDENTVLNFGSANTVAGEGNFTIYSANNLPNITVNNNSGNSPELKMEVVPLTIDGNLITQSAAGFDANGLDLTIMGDLTNNGNFIHNENTSYFSGSETQELTGETIFYNFEKTESNILNVNDNIIVEKEFHISDGTLKDNNNEISVYGNLFNYGIHEYGGSGDGIIIAGPTVQEMVSSGEWGKITLDNPEGILVKTTSDAIVINNAVKLLKGVFDIGGNLLIMNQNAVFIEGNQYSAGNMIRTRLSLTDNGIKKYFASDYTGTFTYPIGSGNKYTPVTFENISLSTNGSVRIKAANEIQPTIQSNASVTDCDAERDAEDNVLQYHWTIDANDGIGGFNADVAMRHEPEDAFVQTPYTLSDYITARLLENDVQWNKYGYDTYDIPSSTLFFTINDADASSINGDYTAGVQYDSNCGAIPDQVPVYISVADGNWTNPDNWAVYDMETGTSGIAGDNVPTGGPRGAVAIIDAGYTIDINTNYISSYKTTIDGILNVGTSYGQRIGLVDGNGELYLERGDMPAAVYDNFILPNTGTFHFGGNTDYDILSNLPTINSLKLSGTGERRFPNLDLTLRGQLIIDGTDNSLAVINEHNRIITVNKNITFNNGAFDAGTGTDAVFVIDGDNLQTISGTNAFTGSNAFNHFEMNNPGGLTLQRPIDIDNNLTFEFGVITTDAANILTLENTADDIVTGASSSAYVNGPLNKNIATSVSGSFEFPTGKDGRYGKVQVIDADTDGYWQAEYYNADPGTASDPENMPSTEFTGNLTTVSENEYWRVEAPAAATAKLQLRWDNSNGGFASNPGDMRIAEWNQPTASAWNEFDATPTAVGDNTAGTITTDIATSYNEFTGSGNFFTIASVYIPQSFTWEGGTDSDWNTGSNWSGGQVPGAMDDIEIPNTGVTNEPIIYSGTAAEAAAVDLQTGRTLTINPGGSLTANGTFTMAGDLIIKSPAGSGASGSFIDNGISGTGSAQIERYLTRYAFHYISMPVQAAAGITSDLFTDIGSSYNPNFYIYDETLDLDGDNSTAPDGIFDTDHLAAGWLNHHGGETGSEQLFPKIGYAHYHDAWTNQTAIFNGTPNTGPMVFDQLTYSLNDPNGGDYDAGVPQLYDGWNLVGNPYPSSVDWDQVVSSLTDIDAGIYVWDEANGGYASYVNGVPGGTGNLSQYIAPMQAFFVRANGDNPEFTLNNSHRAHSSNNYLKNEASDSQNESLLSIAISANGRKNITNVYFHPKATDNFDKRYDAVSIFPASYQTELPTLYSIGTENTVYSTNALPENAAEKSSLPIGVRVLKSGNYTLNFSSSSGLDTVRIFMEDKYTGDTIYIKETPSYSFDHTEGDVKDRFVLHFTANQAPRLVDYIANQSVLEKDFYSFTFNENVFKETDKNDSIVNYSASLYNGNNLPSWLGFEAETKTFSGTPENNDVGTYPIVLLAYDTFGANTKTMFYVEVINVNDAPVLQGQIEDQSMFANEDFNLLIDNDLFIDIDPDDTLSYSASYSEYFESGNMQTWLMFDSETLEFYGTPNNSDAGTFTVTLRAIDKQGASSDTEFDMEVKHTTGVNDLASSDDPYLYPNPAREGFFIALDKSSFAVLTITDIKGSVVRELTFTSDKHYVSTQDLASGMYIVKIRSDEKIHFLKLFVD